MAGILSYGAYIPAWRLNRDEISKSIGSASMKGERAVASWDEDSLTMGVEAGLDCMADIDAKEIDGLYFATVSSPYREKQAAAIMASALDLRNNVYTSDFAGSLRAGTLAIKAAFDAVKAGTLKKVLVIAADARKTMPRSDVEQTYGDGAAALLIGEKKEAIANIEGFSTIVDAIPGPWRRDNDRYSKTFDARIDTRFGLLKNIPESTGSLIKEHGLKMEDIQKFALYTPDGRSAKALATALKVDPKRMQDSLFNEIGIIGTAHSILLLIAALEQAKSGERLICASYGEGSDAVLIQTTDRVEKHKGKHKGTSYISSKKMLSSYGQFLSYKKEIEVGWPDFETSSVAKYWRDEHWLLPLYGMKCAHCETLQYPVKRVCSVCNHKDNHVRVKLARKGKVFTYTHDYLLGPGNQPSDGINPATRLLIELDDGCRIWMEMVDHNVAEVDVGISVELTFRLLHQKSNFNFYGWRARPLR